MLRMCLVATLMLTVVKEVVFPIVLSSASAVLRL